MPEFTVIESGGQVRQPDDWQSDYVREAFRHLIIETLRALASGGDPGVRILAAMRDFTRHASETSTPPGLLVHEEMRELFRQGLRLEIDNTLSDARKTILLTGLQMLAVCLSDDPVAKRCRTKREDAFVEAIESYVLERELQSREQGWSYLQGLAARLAEGPPQPPI